MTGCAACGTTSSFCDLILPAKKGMLNRGMTTSGLGFLLRAWAGSCPPTPATQGRLIAIHRGGMRMHTLGTIQSVWLTPQGQFFAGRQMNQRKSRETSWSAMFPTLNTSSPIKISKLRRTRRGTHTTIAVATPVRTRKIGKRGMERFSMIPQVMH